VGVWMGDGLGVGWGGGGGGWGVLLGGLFSFLKYDIGWV